MRRAAALIKPLTLLLLASAAFASTGLHFDTGRRNMIPAL
jgi:hypothetical protein